MKLDQEDVTRICQRVGDHGVDTKIVAEQFEISRRRVQQLAKEYRDSGTIPQLDTPGRKHTLCKVGRPQSNGKIERFFQTYDKHRWRLGTLDEFLTFYNEERPHMSLDWDNLETPAGAFDRLVPSPADDLENPLATEVSTDE